jgi:hypothetical protein
MNETRPDYARLATSAWCVGEDLRVDEDLPTYGDMVDAFAAALEHAAHLEAQVKYAGLIELHLVRQYADVFPNYAWTDAESAIDLLVSHAMTERAAAARLEAERDGERAENARLREVLERLIATVEMADPRTGSCMCGMAMEQHTMGDGHSPVDMGEYHAGEAVRSARAALRAATEKGANDE